MKVVDEVVAEEVEAEKVPYVTPISLDFGTNNSIIAIIKEGSQEPSFIKTADSEVRHGTYIYYPETSKEPPIYGVAALHMLPHKNVVLMSKRGLGITASKLTDLSIFNAEVSNPGMVRMIAFKFQIDGKEVIKTAKEVVVDFLKHYKELVDNNVKGEKGWVVTKPQYWNSQQNRAYHECLAKAGITPLKVLAEPTAAISAYRAMATDIVGKKKAMVADLGCGTFDLVFQEDCGDGNFRTFATGGDDLLGSSNIDETFLKALKEDLKKEPGYNEKRFEEMTAENRIKMREMKHLLSTLPQVKKVIAGVTKKPFTFTINQERKDELLEPFYKRVETVILEMINRFVVSSKRKYTEIEIRNSVELVAMVGGGMKMPFFGEKLFRRLFPNAIIVGKPNQHNVNPDEAVAVGAAFWAASLIKTPLTQGLPPEPVNSMVLTKTLGVETVTNLGEPNMKRWFSKIVEANTSIPCTAMEDNFTTCRDNQKRVQVEIYQGEGTYTTDDGVTKIGKFEVEIETPNVAYEPKIEIEMEITDDNILEVRAGEKGKEKVAIKIEEQL